MFDDEYDFSFCARQDCSHKDCYRHYDNVNWDKVPENWGVSVADFGMMCERYDGDINGETILDKCIKEETEWTSRK